MTDKELFEKTEKRFNLKKSDKVNKIFEEGNFNKILNEIKGPKQPTGIGKATGGFLSRVAAAIPGTRGYRMRSAEAKKAEAETKKAEVEARLAQQQQMKGKSITKTKQQPEVKKQPGVNFKVGDEVFVRTKKNPKAPGTVTKLLDKPGFVQVKVGNAPYAFDKRNVTLKRGINKESFEYIVKKYR